MVYTIFKKNLENILEKLLDSGINNDYILNSGENKNIIYFIKSLINKKGIENILMNYKVGIDGKNFSSNDWEKNILGLNIKSLLVERDSKRYFLGSVPFANYVFNTILNSGDNNIIIKVDFLDEINPFKQKYNNIELKTLQNKFECLRDYINENSFALDAAAIGGMTGATDFLQLYKYVIDKEIIKEDNDRKDIIKKLFIVLKTESIISFNENYHQFIDLLESKKNKEDKKLPRLYNRLYFIFSFILNNLKPDKFPVYFSATRNTLKVFGIEGYENVAKIYNDFINEFNTKENESIINAYLKGVGIDKNSYCPELEKEFPFDNKIIFGNYTTKRSELFTNHAKYRFFQDLCWVINRNILDGQDYVNNLGKGQKFNYEELKNKIYPFEKIEENKLDITENFKENGSDEKNKKITFGEIINIDYLISEGYITEISPGEYQVIKTDTYFIRDKK